MATQYTFTKKTGASQDNFSGLSVDANHIGMTGAIGAGPQTVDVSGTPVVSPATISNSAVTTLTIPLDATQVSFYAVTNTVNLSESNSAVTDHYFTIPTGVQITLDVARCGVLYLKANTGASTLSFFFNVV